MENKNTSSLILGVGSFLAASVGISLSAALQEEDDALYLLDSIDENSNPLTASHEEGGCGEGKCGEEGEKGEGECGEGQCGEDSDKGEDESEGDESEGDESEEEETTEE